LAEELNEKETEVMDNMQETKRKNRREAFNKRLTEMED
jgi:hypothetical protein